MTQSSRRCSAFFHSFILRSFLLFFVVGAGFSAPSRAQIAAEKAPVAGAAIENRASVDYEIGNQPVHLDSNVVTVFVSSQEALSLTADNTQQAAPNATVSLPHRLTNLGNVAANYTLSVANLGGDNYDLQNLTIYRDLNGNGQQDSGEPQVGVGDTISLQPGAFADLVVVGRVPANATAGQSAQVRLTAVSSAQNQSASNTDTVTITEGVAVRVLKSAQPQSAGVGQVVTFTLTTTSYGSTPPAPIPVVVDGAPRNLIVLRDAIPANTVFVGLTEPANATRLYHRLGDPFDSYTTTAPAAAEIDAVAFGLDGFNSAGQSVQASLQVRVTQGGVTIRNTALFEYSNGVDAGTKTTPSNEVIVTTPTAPPVLQYFTNNTFGRVATATGVGQPLFLQAIAPTCNQDPTQIETETIAIRSALTGDTLQVLGTETGPNTGIFHTAAIPTSGDAANPGDLILQTRRDDVLTATLVDCGGVRATTTIAVDPFGIVFDSRTNAPLAGASVTLIDVNTGNPAQVFAFDGVTPAPSTVVTGADGSFQFPQVAPGTYRLQITPPVTYKFPSVVPPALLPPSRSIDALGSYGGNFTLGNGGAVQIDVPLDSPPPSGLFIEKNVSRRTVDLGDFLDYRIEIRNNSGIFLNTVRVNDVLPDGFSLLKGSVRYDGIAVADPAGAPGPQLTFSLPDLIADQKVIVTYRVKVGVNAARGDNKNRARWSGNSPSGTSTSNVATATVTVQGGVFTTRGIIFGKVFVDENRNRIQDQGEIGIPGVRIYLEDGTFAITDSEGKYSIYGAGATSHNVKLDKTTMPAGSQLELLTNRNLGSSDSVLADLKSGEMHKVNFAESSATEEILKLVRQRRNASANFATESERGVRTALTTETATATPSDTRGLPASGIIGGGSLNGGALNGNTTNGAANGTSSTRSSYGANAYGVNQDNGVNFSSGLGGIASSGATGTSLNARGAVAPFEGSDTPARSALSGPLDGQSSPPQSAVESLSTAGALSEHVDEELNSLLHEATPDLAFLDLKNKDTLPTNQVNVRIKGALGSTFRLSVNGEEVSEARVGTRSELASKGVQAWEYIGVRLKAGENALVATQVDPFGNVRGTQTISLVAPGDLGHLRVLIPRTTLPADGRSLVAVKVLLTDDKGIKVTARTPVTLEAGVGQWQTIDLNPTTPGVQVFIEGGEGNFQLLSPLQPGQVLVRATSGLLESTQKLTFVPELRPLIASGIADVRLNLFGFKPKSARSIRTSDIFEDDLQSLSKNFSGGNDATGRTALFLKGQVQGKYLLTLRYDSAQQSGERLFRDIQPDEFYPVYGDSSTKGYDAQSTSRLYVRVDRNQSYALYGDYTTSTQDQLLTLGRYSRSLNGLQFHHETERFSATAYQSRDSTRQLVTEIRGRGLSGPYSLGNADILAQSEKVEIIVRDRNQPSVILSTTPQTRFVDYEIDGLSNGILFRRPVPSLDADLNPVSIRVTYEVETGGPKFDIYGANGQFKVTKNLQVGASYNRASDPDAPSTMMGLSAVLRLTPNTVLIGEWAHTDRSGVSSTGNLTGLAQRQGSGTRFELLHNDKKLQARLYSGRTTRGFDNPEAELTQGRSETSASATYALSAKTRLLGEAIRTKDLATGQKLSGAQLSVDTAVGKNLRAQAGLRYSSGNTNAVTLNPNGDGSGSVGSGGSSTLSNENRSFTSLFGRVTAQVSPKGNLFGRYEKDLSGNRQSFSVGGDYQIANRTRVYVAHEFLDSLGGLYALNESQRSYNTRFGIESDYMRNGRVYSEYRLGDGIDGRSAQAALGLRNLWNLAPGLRLNTSLERVRQIGGSGAANTNDSTSAGIGLEYLAQENLKATARIETRTGSNSTGFLNSFGVAYKPGRDLTFLTRNTYTRSNNSGAASQVQDRFQLGLAYRQTDIDKLSALAKYEYRYDQNTNASASSGLFPNTRRSVHILSGDLNYQPSATLDASLHYAWKRLNERSLGLEGNTNAQLLSGRVTKDLNEKFDFSLMASTLWSGGSGGRQYGLGAELGYALQRNLLLSAGYNFVGYRDRDLAEETFSKRGLYLRLRFKFDERLFRSLQGKTSLPDSSPGFTPITSPGISPILVPGSNLFGAAPGQLEGSN